LEQRSIIRNNLKDLLIGKTIAETRVFVSRTRNLRPQDLPAIVIYTPEEEVLLESTGRGMSIRALSLQVEAALIEKKDADLEIDDFSGEIEGLVMNDRSLGGASRDTELKKSEFVVERFGNHETALLRQEYRVTYSHLARGAE
jgi:hypothetical protein